ncbi:hypothetical protein O6H91_02G084300 [Diphasiastrum complanatum]|uniref:Uncharacterized protein n=1 Tax=Diphasiastrum complanatum TaxID=34168 RepID=A0ACC2EHM6_DIPCM|nr:hypothetical protein O6H91_02G084300 [Diphasiastrum complanatum]
MSETKSSSLAAAINRRNSPKGKQTLLEAPVGGDVEAMENPVDTIKVFSEKELTREVEKVAATLTPDQDWSIRMAAMQRVEGLVFGGAIEYTCFPSLLKQLVGPLTVQLSDRRSSIVKQACHLLNLLSKELLADFESCAEAFIPALFKLVVITVLVIAESADNCIKTMLRNCRVARVLPRIVDCAKHDRNAVLRARCCDYALLMLEQWADSSEIQRSIDLYEDLIKSCVGDAMSEVRSTARSCYRLFAKTWPNRARRLFSSFDPVIQRLILEEDGGFHKRYASPSVRDKGAQQARNATSHSINVVPQSTAPSGTPISFSTPASTDVDRNSNHVGLGPARIRNSSLDQKNLNEHAPERTLESILQSSQQQVNAIESMLRGLDLAEHGMVSATSRVPNKDPVGGSYLKIHAPAAPARVGIDPPSARDPPFPASTPASSQVDIRAPSLTVGYPSASHMRTGSNGSIENVNMLNVAPLQTHGILDAGKRSFVSGVNRDGSSGVLTSIVARRVPMATERPTQQALVSEAIEGKGPKRVLKQEASYDKLPDFHHNAVPGFQRPLLRTAVSARSSGSSRSSLDDNQPLYGDVFNCTDGLMSLNDALTEGLSTSADWSARVTAFNYLKKSLQQGARGLQDVTQSFERVMKLFHEHLDDPHHKVAQAALTTLAELVPACKKLFEAYLERILPLVFSRLVDTKEVIRQLGTSALEIVGNTYSIDSLLPALLRSLDEQRSPKAKVAVIEFAIAAFTKLALNGEAGGGTGLLKLWLTKLAPLASDKNSKLKEVAINGIIAVYSHFDSTTVLNFILALSIEEQSVLRRALKQYTPRIEVDLMTYLQSRSQRTRSRPMSEQGDIATPSEEGYPGFSSKTFSSLARSQSAAGYSSGSINSDGGRKWSSTQSDTRKFECPTVSQHSIPDSSRQYYQDREQVVSPEDPLLHGKTKDTRSNLEHVMDRSGMQPEQDKMSSYGNPESGHGHAKPRSLSINGRKNSMDNEHCISKGLGGTEAADFEARYDDNDLSEKINEKSLLKDSVLSVPTLLQQPAKEKRQVLQEIMKLSRANNASVWSELSDRVLVVVLETLEDSDLANRELALVVILDMLNNQKKFLEGSVEVLLQRLLHSSKDQVSCGADSCLSSILSQCDPYKCLSVVVPLLVSEDEKMLVTCISALTKIVTRLPSEQLMAQLPSFLPALFNAFGNENADVRKTVVFCLVDIYIILGKAFVPYLGSLSSTQLRLVTIYANRISQARLGASMDSPQ